jgi:hypothetical protein
MNISVILLAVLALVVLFAIYRVAAVHPKVVDVPLPRRLVDGFIPVVKHGCACGKLTNHHNCIVRPR